MLTINNTPSTPQFRDVDGIFIQSACFQLIFQHTLNFLLHILLCDFREMGGHNIRCLSDFLDKGWTALCIYCIVHSFFLQKSPTRIKSFLSATGQCNRLKKTLKIILAGRNVVVYFFFIQQVALVAVSDKPRYTAISVGNPFGNGIATSLQPDSFFKGA